MSKKAYKEGEGPWTFHAHHTRTIVLDPADQTKILAEFQDHQFITEDPKIAQYLSDHNYEEWTPISPDDEIPLIGGGSIKISKLPPKLAAELIGKPIKKLISAKERISEMLAKEEDPPTDPESGESEPIGAYVCEWCEKAFDSQPALNGHKANCKKKPE